MADNIAITAGSGVTIAADDIGGVQYQRVKISQGADGAATDVSSAAPLQVSLANHAANATAVKVDGSAVTQPVSLTSTTITGTVAATQSGTWTVQPGNTANTTAWKVDGSAVTQPVSLATLPVTNAGTFVVQENGAALTALQLIDNAVSGAGFNITQLGGAAVPIGAGLETTAVRVTLPTDGTGVVKLGAGTAEIGKLAAGTANIGDVDVLTIAAGDNNIGNVDIVTMPSVVLTAETTKVIGTVNVAAAQTIAVTNAGTFAVQATAVGTIADDATTPGAPVMIGGKAVETDGTDPTSVSAEDDVAILRTDRNRRLLVSGVHPNLWSANEDHTSAQTNNALKAAPGANLSLYITDLVVSNGATAGIVQFVEDTAGTPVNKTGKLYLAINGGAVMNFKTPIRITANKDFGFTSTTCTTHTITVNGFIAP